MASTKKPNPIMALFVFFMIITISCFLFKNWLDAKKIDHLVVLSGNCILFLLTVVIFSLHKKSLKNKNPHAFVRSVMTGTFIKMIVILAAVAVYLLLAGDNKSLYAVVATIVLYFVYTFIEVRSAAKLNKEHASN